MGVAIGQLLVFLKLGVGEVGVIDYSSCIVEGKNSGIIRLTDDITGVSTELSGDIIETDLGHFSIGSLWHARQGAQLSFSDRFSERPPDEGSNDNSLGERQLHVKNRC